MTTKKKISFRVPPWLWDDFSQRAAELFLNRAPFMDYMIRREIPELRKELAGRRLSTAANRYISGELKKKEPKSVNIEVGLQTANMLNSVVKESNLVRDAFLCRLLIILRSTDALLNYLEIPKVVGSSIRHPDGGIIGLAGMPTSPLVAMEAVRDDPFFYLRTYLENDEDNYGIYMVPFPKNLDWAACFLDDEQIKGTRAFKASERIALELAKAYASEESFQKTTNKKNGGQK